MASRLSEEEGQLGVDEGVVLQGPAAVLLIDLGRDTGIDGQAQVAAGQPGALEPQGQLLAVRGQRHDQGALLTALLGGALPVQRDGLAVVGALQWRAAGVGVDGAGVLSSGGELSPWLSKPGAVTLPS